MDVRAVVQRVLSASVTVDDETVGEIGPGLLVYLGVTHTDGQAEIAWLARKVWELRILRDERSASDVAPDPRGQPVHALRRRPQGPAPDLARRRPAETSEPAYDAFCAELERLGATVARGVFGGDMRVASVNDGPDHRAPGDAVACPAWGQRVSGGGHPGHDHGPDVAGVGGPQPADRPAGGHDQRQSRSQHRRRAAGRGLGGGGGVLRAHLARRRSDPTVLSH